MRSAIAVTTTRPWGSRARPFDPISRIATRPATVWAPTFELSVPVKPLFSRNDRQRPVALPLVDDVGGVVAEQQIAVVLPFGHPERTFGEGEAIAERLDGRVGGNDVVERGIQAFDRERLTRAGADRGVPQRAATRIPAARMGHLHMMLPRSTTFDLSAACTPGSDVRQLRFRRADQLNSGTRNAASFRGQPALCLDL